MASVLLVPTDDIVPSRTDTLLSLDEAGGSRTTRMTLGIFSFLASMTARDFVRLWLSLDLLGSRCEVKRGHTFLDIFAKAHYKAISTTSF